MANRGEAPSPRGRFAALSRFHSVLELCLTLRSDFVVRDIRLLAKRYGQALGAANHRLSFPSHFMCGENSWLTA